MQVVEKNQSKGLHFLVQNARKNCLDVLNVELFLLNINVIADLRDLKMSTVAIKVKVMPEGLDSDLEEIKRNITEKIENEGGKIAGFEEQPIAFGLKALIATFAWLEAKETSIVEEIFKNIPGVSSSDIIDYRRAFG